MLKDPYTYFFKATDLNIRHVIERIKTTEYNRYRGTSVLTNDIRYGTFHYFSKVMMAISRDRNAVYIPKAQLETHPTQSNKQWEPLTAHDLTLLGQRVKECYHTRRGASYEL